MSQPATQGNSAHILRLVLFLFIASVVVVALVQFRQQLTLEALAQHESTLRRYQQSHPVLVLGLAFLIYVAATGLSLPGATALTLVYAWYFGFVMGVILISFASTSGATLAFLLSRYLFRDAIQQRFGDRLGKFNQKLAEEGAFYLFTLRLTPIIPFFVINLVMGLTPIKTRTFWWVSQLGMLAGTVVYVYAGSSFPSLSELAEKGATGILTPKLFVAFGLLGLFPITVKRIMARVNAGGVKPTLAGMPPQTSINHADRDAQERDNV